MRPLSIVFAGTPEFGLPCLEALAGSVHRLTAVYTQPDRPAGRGRQLQPSAVKRWAVNHGLPVYQPVNFKTPEAVDELAALKPDLMVVIAYGLILPGNVLTIPRLGCINVHASLLPRWRGASPIQQAILHGDKQSGVTIMQMDVGLDTGDSLVETACELTESETAASLHDKLAQLAPKALLDAIDALAEGRAKPVVQNHALATYASKIAKDDARIDWHQSAEVIDRQIRAYNPWPVAYTQMGEESLRIYQARIELDTHSKAPGTVLSIDKRGMRVATGEGVLCIEILQFPGGKAMRVADWLNAGRAGQLINQVLQ
ncbi:methionyl-tRNA formyltransferase [Legionella rubrilucens]|uniref:Methionyl-tRNA formyltransferase n=1 Tax=Legionella rubrilucens TaxID=458 RepID=A0A0W0XQ54_9GAMM|nr:methionyl-tRNA formyltransferase [Legionella rubrilucens]KTD46829.1 methionyl-tRNA formyltransferase [Legionella rubrilucens]